MNDSDFDDLLRSARGESLLPHSFRKSVWRRIENEAAQAKPMSWIHGIFSAITKPLGAATGLVATIALGLWVGARTVPDNKPSATTYAQSISPFAHPHH